MERLIDLYDMHGVLLDWVAKDDDDGSMTMSHVPTVYKYSLIISVVFVIITVS